MRRATIGIVTLAFALLTAGSLQAQDPAPPTVDVTGEWELQTETPRGPQTSTVTFVQDGATLSGHLTTPRGEIPIASGSVSGNTITFTIRMEMGQRSFERTYTGTVEGDTAQGTVPSPRGGTIEWTARRVG